MAEEEKECEINMELNDLCEYLDIPVCCHPEYNAGEVDEAFCLKCVHRVVPIKGKAISLLHELVMLSSNTGWELESYVGYDNNPESQTPNQKLLTELSQKVEEVKKFLEAVGIRISEGETNNGNASVGIKRKMGRRTKGST